jgi:UDP-N-acetylglucosamine 2-epimerase (non-hydrolysing)
VVMGTRPEIIKLSPVLNMLDIKNTHVVFSGQHYDYNLSIQFIEELGLCRPDSFLKLTKSNPSVQISEMILKLSRIIDQIKPDTLVVEGDTNTVLAASIASIKSGVPVSHVESGPRSFDWRMPEEHNRIQVDHISELLFAPSELAKKNLEREHVHGRIYVTGNTVIDVIEKYADIAEKRSKLELDIENFILMTLHRAENVDNKKTLSDIIKAVIDSNEKIIFPIHPRTVKRLKEFGLYSKVQSSQDVLLIEPIGYFDMLKLMKKCSFIITDSGGIQQEATSPKIRKKVLVTRITTDSPEAVQAGVAEVVGIRYSGILPSIKKTARNPHINSKATPYGRGNAARRIVKIMKSYF